MQNHGAQLLFYCFIPLLFAGCRPEPPAEKCCPCIENEGLSDRYIFPIVPNTPEWVALETREEMYEVCQVPEPILDDMCPAGLVQTWLTYPLRMNLFAWNNPQDGFDELMLRFNLLETLLTTHGTAFQLLQSYHLYDLQTLEINSTKLDTGSFHLELYLLEVTIAQKGILEQLEVSQKREVINKALENRGLKDADSSYSLFHISDAYIMSSMMLLDDYAPFKQAVAESFILEYFVEEGSYLTVSGSEDPYRELNLLLDHARNYLNQL